MITRIPLYKREGFPTTYAAAIRLINQNYKKEAVNQVLKSTIVTTKNHLTYHCANTIPSYQKEYRNLKTKQLNKGYLGR